MHDSMISDVSAHAKFWDLLGNSIRSKRERERMLQDIEKTLLSIREGCTTRHHEALTLLHEVMCLAKSHSEVAWDVTTILDKVASSLSSDHPLLNEFQRFVPQLIRILSPSKDMEKEMSLRKKHCILKLVKMFTYYPKTNIVEPYLKGTIDGLVSLILKRDDEVTPVLALSALVNVLNSNNFAMFMLLNHPDLKALMNQLSAARDQSEIKLEACKLAILMRPLIGCSDVNAEDEMFFELTFYVVQNYTGEVLSHCVKFISTLIEVHKMTLEVSESCLNSHVQNFLSFLKALQDPKREDVFVYFTFLKVLAKVGVADLSNLFPEMLNIVLSLSVLKGLKCPDALDVCSIIMSSMKNESFQGDKSCLTAVLDKLCAQIIPQLFEPFPSDKLQSYEAKRVNILFQLSVLRFLFRGSHIPSLNTIIERELMKRDLVSSIKISLECSLSSSGSSNLETELCLMSLDLLSTFAQGFSMCQELLMDEKTISLLANTFKSKDSRLVSKVLSMISSTFFPRDRFPLLAKYIACNEPTSVGTFEESNIEPKDVSHLTAMQLYEEQIKSLTNTEQVLEIQLSEASIHNQALRNRLSVSNQLRCQLQQELNCVNYTLKEVCEDLRCSRQMLKSKEEEAKQHFSALSKENARLKESAASLEQDFADKKKKNEILKKEINVLNCTLSESNLKLEQAQKEMTQLKEELLCLKEQLKEMKGSSDQKEQEVEKLSNLLNELKIEKKEIEDERSKIQAKMTEVVETYARTEKELAKLRKVHATICQLTADQMRPNQDIDA